MARIVRVAALLRVSTTKVEQEESPEHQLAYIREEIKRHRGDDIWVDTGLVYEDELTGALVLERPGIQRLLADVEAGKVDLVAMKSIARLGRDTLGLLALKRKLWDDLGVDLVALQDGYRASRDQELIFLIHADRAQHGRLEISRNVRNAIRQLARRGAWPVGTVPFGYVRVDRHHIEPHPETAKIVQEIFRLRGEERWGLAAIQDYLNNVLQVPAPHWWSHWHLRRSRLESLAQSDDRWAAKLEKVRQQYEGKRPLWRKITVSQILRNTAYYGELRFYRRYWRRTSSGKVKLEFRPPDEHIVIQCPPLVSRELWERANEPIRVFKKGPPKRSYLLTGLVYCGFCGAPLQGFVNHHDLNLQPYEKPFYGCANRRESLGCPMPHIPAALLEPVVVEHVKLALQRMAELPPPTERAYSTGKDELKKLEAELVDLRDQRRYYRNEHRLGRIPGWELDQEIARIEQREQQVIQMIDRLRAEFDENYRAARRQQIYSIARQFERLEVGTQDELRLLLLEAVKTITVTYAGPREAAYPVPISPPKEIVIRMLADEDGRPSWIAELLGCSPSKIYRLRRGLKFPPGNRHWDKIKRDAFRKRWLPVLEALGKGADPEDALAAMDNEPLFKIRVELRLSLV